MTDTSTEMLALAERIKNVLASGNAYTTGTFTGLLRSAEKALRSASAGGRPDREASIAAVVDVLRGNSFALGGSSHTNNIAGRIVDALSLHPVGPDTFSVGILEQLPPTQEYVLRAMASNYAMGNRWDGLDKEACIKAADEIRALRSALPLPGEKDVQTSGWRDISTAPKDGTTIDLWDRGLGRMPDCYWGFPSHVCGEAGQYCDSDWHSLEAGWVDGTFNESVSEDGLTHWMPCPEGPLSTDASACPSDGFLRSSLNKNNLSTPPSVEDVARVVDPVSWAVTPQTYGLHTEEELESKTLIGGLVQLLAKRPSASSPFSNHPPTAAGRRASRFVSL